ncbi:MAG: glycerol kinase GlpK [Propionibacteriaceae bacterium]|nr:glycerol kinase GlpK [Propionibacteriaceae bacterium]
MSERRYVLSIDQGTTSTRAIVFDHSGHAVAVGQTEHQQIFPQPGWVEHDPLEIWTNTLHVVALALTRARITHLQVAAVGITNQRETTVVWDVRTGQPVTNAIVWQDTRTADLCRELAGDAGADRWKSRVGLPLATYFSGPKVRWILDNVDGARADAEAGHLRMGTIDAWLIWNLTGGPNGGLHLTDVTNASRTMLMDLRTLAWDTEIVDAMGIPASMLPEIRPSVGDFGAVGSTGLLMGIPIAGVLGDQQAAMFGQTCFEPGMAKNTYGTGCFVLANTGTEVIESPAGLLSTVCYQITNEPAVYALEGSIAVAGSLVQWLRDNLGLIASAPEVEELAASVDDNGGAYIVPAFSGLFAPYWRDDARGVIAGLTRYVTKAHLARAALEASAYQTRDVVEAMQTDSGTPITELRVDGGMTENALLMQFQADQLGIDVIRPTVIETTALGAAYAAGVGVGFWSGTDELTANWSEEVRWSPAQDRADADRLHRNWTKAVERTLDWVDADT